MRDCRFWDDEQSAAPNPLDEANDSDNSCDHCYQCGRYGNEQSERAPTTMVVIERLGAGGPGYESYNKRSDRTQEPSPPRQIRLAYRHVTTIVRVRWGTRTRFTSSRLILGLRGTGRLSQSA